jgi:hypothetical protein
MIMSLSPRTLGPMTLSHLKLGKPNEEYPPRLSLLNGSMMNTVGPTIKKSDPSSSTPITTGEHDISSLEEIQIPFRITRNTSLAMVSPQIPITVITMRTGPVKSMSDAQQSVAQPTSTALSIKSSPTKKIHH